MSGKLIGVGSGGEFLETTSYWLSGTSQSSAAGGGVGRLAVDRDDAGEGSAGRLVDAALDRRATIRAAGEFIGTAPTPAPVSCGGGYPLARSACSLPDG